MLLARTRLLTLPLLLLVLSACKTDGGFQGTGPAEVPATETEEQAEEDPAYELKQARGKLELAELAAQKALAEAEQEVRSAEHSAEEARRELAAFAEIEKAHRTDEARLELERATNRASEAESELAELEAMYAEEQFATLTKELVLIRGRRALEVARKQLELDRQKLDLLTNHELPTEEAAKTWALGEAQFKLGQAKQALRHAQVEQELALQEARRAVEKLEAKQRSQEGAAKS
jgi:hypothetical protein